MCFWIERDFSCNDFVSDRGSLLKLQLIFYIYNFFFFFTWGTFLCSCFWMETDISDSVFVS